MQSISHQGVIINYVSVVDRFLLGIETLQTSVYSSPVTKSAVV
jgi:hypothetical protein